AIVARSPCCVPSIRAAAPARNCRYARKRRAARATISSISAAWRENGDWSAIRSSELLSPRALRLRQQAGAERLRRRAEARQAGDPGSAGRRVRVDQHLDRAAAQPRKVRGVDVDLSGDGPGAPGCRAEKHGGAAV